MSNDGSFHKDEVFNLETEQGVTHLLLSIRASSLSAPQKNELRDLVFLYTNGGHDESVKIALDQKISTLKVEPVVTKVANVTNIQPPVAHPFGTSRPLPTFTPATPQVQKPETPSTPTPVEPTPKTIEPIQSETVVQSAPASTPVPPEPTETPAAQIKPEPTPVIPLEPVSIPAAPSEPVVTTSPAPASTTKEVTAPISFDPEQNLNRIREIKSVVNSQVGNPVNLIDINNEVGREYMAALLDAMKKVSGGSSATSAMSRLETAFVAVQDTLDKHNDSKDNSAENTPLPPSLEKEPLVSVEAVIPPTHNQTPADLPTKPPAPIEESVTETEKTAVINPKITPQPVSTPVAPIERKPIVQAAPAAVPIVNLDLPKQPLAQTESRSPVTQASTSPTEAASPAIEPKFRSIAQQDAPEANSVVSLDSPQVESKPDPVINTPTKPIPEPPAEFESNWGPAADTIKPVENATPQRIASLANVKEKLRTPTDLADPTSIDTSSVTGDPLYTDEVDNGLEQLLSEWPIFKKSGLFGTGPKGRAHPLFTKVSNLQIPLLLAGRFEGATQETKQSITDYMNGWRYEQGIIYEQGENFEHYLRRVIRHILDLQNRKPSA